MTGPCAKQVVRATLIATDGSRFIGENDCLNPQTICPRAGLPTGQGYELCRDICHQTNHAEVNAILKAGAKASGSIIYLEGHTYACDPCKRIADACGVNEIVIGSPPQD